MSSILVNKPFKDEILLQQFWAEIIVKLNLLQKDCNYPDLQYGNDLVYVFDWINLSCLTQIFTYYWKDKFPKLHSS